MAKMNLISRPYFLIVILVLKKGSNSNNIIYVITIKVTVIVRLLYVLILCEHIKIKMFPVIYVKKTKLF